MKKNKKKKSNRLAKKKLKKRIKKKQYRVLTSETVQSQKQSVRF